MLLNKEQIIEARNNTQTSGTLIGMSDGILEEFLSVCQAQLDHLASMGEESLRKEVGIIICHYCDPETCVGCIYLKEHGGSFYCADPKIEPIMALLVAQRGECPGVIVQRTARQMGYTAGVNEPSDALEEKEVPCPLLKSKVEEAVKEIRKGLEQFQLQEKRFSRPRRNIGDLEITNSQWVNYWALKDDK